MELHLLEGRQKKGYTTFGCCWEKGEVTGTDFVLKDSEGNQLPMQSSVQAYWPDGSAKWSAHRADAEVMTDTVSVEPARHSDNTPDCQGIFIEEETEGWRVDTEALCLTVPKQGLLAKDISVNGKILAKSVYPVFQLEHRESSMGVQRISVKEFQGEICSVELEESGPLQAVFCFRGNHVTEGEAKMPFVIRMYLWPGSGEMKLVHTYLFDGVENRDFLKGMGIRLETDLGGEKYNRHVQFAMEKAVFHETAVILSGFRPRIQPEVLKAQLSGEMLSFETGSDVAVIKDNLPLWNHYRLIQDSAYHFGIRKQTLQECCELPCIQGKRSLGAMAVAGENGGVAVGIRDFWQKCPGELEVSGLGLEQNAVTAWFYSPAMEAYDFRHYDTRSYSQTCYEGFDYVGASAYGIGVTGECTVKFTGRIMTDEEVLTFGKTVQKPCVYVGNPEYYHRKRAFGYWSLPCGETECERWLENQMAQAFAFYKEEIENRDWYGLFDYGDVMHTYDAVRHTWKYDVGGFAWQNTELVPTYWLWLYFLRTGREDVFTLAEAMSRHCSEVDTYHFGPYQGLGSRHNVRHWGCSCKEPRIGMAGHHRFLYYLTGDARIGDVMEDVKDADLFMAEQSYCRTRLSDGTRVPGVRSGPDWSSYVSNWMTHYERTLDENYRRKIEQGIADIYNTPFGLRSGPDYGYDKDRAHLIYNGESENTPNQHLQICMGGPQVWLEVADMLEDNRLVEMMADLGAFYYLPKEEKSRLTAGRILNRPFSWPMFATAVSALAAEQKRDEALAAQTWEILINDLLEKGGKEGYVTKCYGLETAENTCREIAWNTTNCTAQWCLNVIMCLEFIREFLPAE